MSTRARLQNANDSKSLWNYTLSPGWSEFDAHILRLAVMRYGCGAWREINKHFPLKTCGQLNLQTQRLFGQQALAEFNKVHIDPSRIKEINDKIDGFRKNTCLINEGNNLTAEEKEARRKKHIEKYGIPKEIYEQIQVPVVLDPPVPCKTVLDDIEKLREMYRAVYDIQLRRKHLQMNNGKNSANIALKAKQDKIRKNQTKKAQKSNDNNNNNKNEKEKESKEQSMDVENENDNDKDQDNDVEIIDVKKPKKKEPEPEPVAPAFNEDVNMMDMDEETAMALALSASMASTNINTPAVEKKSKSKKKSTSKKKNKTKSGKKSSKKKSGKKSRKRKKMDSDGDEEYVPGGVQPKKKRSRKKL